MQALSIGLGFVVTAMFFLGVVFAALWATAYFLGERIDRERAERLVLEQEWQAEHGNGPVGPDARTVGGPTAPVPPVGTGGA